MRSFTVVWTAWWYIPKEGSIYTLLAVRTARRAPFGRATIFALLIAIMRFARFTHVGGFFKDHYEIIHRTAAVVAMCLAFVYRAVGTYELYSRHSEPASSMGQL